MNNINIDDWLNSLGVDDDSDATLPASGTASPSALEAAYPSIPEVVESQPQVLSGDDVDDILSENGFQEVHAADAEEVTDGEEEIYDENIGEGRDLDAEEDADWDTQEATGNIAPVQAWSAPSSIGSNDTAVPPSQEPLLPPNSPTLLLEEATSRFSGAEWYEAIKRQYLTIAGCGGIGSHVAFQIGRMHPMCIYLYDDDRVERANLSGQLFSLNDVGEYKVNAIANIVQRGTNTSNIYCYTRRFTTDCTPTDIMICGFDNMKARRAFFNSWLRRVECLDEENRKNCLYLDGRLSVDTLQILCIKGDDLYNMDRYEQEFLFSDEDADATVCSMKQTTYMACMIGALMTNLFVNFVASNLDPVIPYDLPFFTEYDAQNMLFKTEN